MRRREWLTLVLVLAAATLFRLPPLLNAGAVNSDAAVVGLQARHLLKGEWAWHLWGAPYQGSLDVALAALALAVAPSSPAVIIAVPFLGLLAMVALTFDLLRRRVGVLAAAVAVVPQVFAPMPANMPMFFVMRQSMAALLVLAVWLTERATTTPDRARRVTGFFLAAAATGLALWADTFALVMAGPLALFMLAAALVRPPLEALRHVVAALLGGAALVPLARLSLAGSQGFATLGGLGARAVLLWRDCLPFVLGAKVFLPHPTVTSLLWESPWPVRLVQQLGAAALVLGVGSAGLLAFNRRIDWAVRRLGLLGLASTVAALAAFLVSSRPEDVWAARYLAPLTWTAPFALAPVALTLGQRRFSAAFAPYVLSALIGGWVAYGPLVDGARLLPPYTGEAEHALGELLRRENVTAATANYWLAYRLAFLFDENPVVVPFEGDDDRYPAWRTTFEAGGRRAYLFHPSAPRNTPDATWAELNARGPSFERTEVGGYTVLLESLPLAPSR